MNYRYHNIGKHLVCLDQSIYSAIKIVGLGHDRNKLKSIGVSRAIGRKAIKLVTRDKLRLLKSRNHVLLPVFGQIAMTVHRGFKVFDFHRHEVTKVFAPDVSNQDAAREINASRKVSKIESAPDFLLADPDLAWFREEYICGTHGTDIVSGRNSEYIEFYPDVEKCLLELVAVTPPTNVELHAHINGLVDKSFSGSWQKAGLRSEDVDEIVQYMKQLRQWLVSQAESDQLQLVLTHGDFSLVNAIATDTGLRFVDWESIAPGGLYSDVLNFLFVELYYGRASRNFAKEMLVLVGRYRESILAQFQHLERAASMAPTFARQLYYLERLKQLIGRSASVNLRDVVCRTIGMFRKIDDEIGDIVR